MSTDPCHSQRHQLEFLDGRIRVKMVDISSGNFSADSVKRMQGELEVLQLQRS